MIAFEQVLTWAYILQVGGWKSYDLVLRYAHVVPERLSFVVGRIERRASKLVEEAPRAQ